VIRLEQFPRVSDIPQPLPGIPLQAFPQQPAHLRGNALPIRVFRHHCREGIRDSIALEQLITGEQLPQHDSESPNIGALIDGQRPSLLGRHISRGAHDDSRHGQRRRIRGTGILGCVVFCGLGQPKIQDLDYAIGLDLDVGGLQIAVNNALFVRGFERIRNLARDAYSFFARQRSAGGLPRPAPLPGS
jgi:hypothetical protein